MEAKDLALWITCILLVVITITAYVRLNYLIDNQGDQIQILLKHEKENFPVVPGVLQSAASGFNKRYNNLLSADQNKLWQSTAKDPTRLYNNDRYGPQNWLASNYAGKYGNNAHTAATTDDTEPGENPISVQTNTSTDFSQAEPFSLL